MEKSFGCAAAFHASTTLPRTGKYLLAVTLDITEHKRAEQALLDAKR